MTNKRVTLILGVAALVAVAVAAWVQIGAPLERTEGIVQKSMYVHVPSAWAMYVGFLVNFVMSIVFLITGKRGVDRVAIAGAEVGVVFCTLVLVSGPIWAKAVWGIWWDWEPRLTMTMVIWFIYVGYLVLRGMAPSASAAARYGAVLGIVGFLLTPVIHQAVTWWGGQHPAQKSNRADALTSGMRTALFVSGACWLVICSFLISLRTQVEKARDASEQRLAGGAR